MNLDIIKVTATRNAGTITAEIIGDSNSCIFAFYLLSNSVRVDFKPYSSSMKVDFADKEVVGNLEIVGFAKNKTTNKIMSVKTPVFDDQFNNEIQDAIFEIKRNLSNAGIKTFYIRLLPSGFGDSLTSANMISYFSELVGLKFGGCFDFDKGAKTHYSDIWRKLVANFIFNENETKIIYFDDLVSSIERIKLETSSIKNGRFNSICFAPRNVISCLGLQRVNGFVDKFLTNSFHNHIETEYRKIIIKDSSQVESIDLLFHVRLGDVGVLHISDFIINPYEFSRLKKNGICFASDLEEFPILQKDFDVLKDIKIFISEVRILYPNMKIGLVTDSYDHTRRMMQSELMKNALAHDGFFYNEIDLEKSINERLDEINSMELDCIQMGDSSEYDFFAAIDNILKSKVIVSNARSFVYNILSNFKPLIFDKKIFFSPIGNYYIRSLEARGIAVRDYKDFSVSSIQAIFS